MYYLFLTLVTRLHSTFSVSYTFFDTSVLDEDETEDRLTFLVL